MDQDKRERMRSIAQKIASLTDDQRTALAQSLPLTTIEGHQLSMHNACMVAMQMQNATVVGGYRQWLKAGRQVRKGEHAICIWVPCSRAKKSDDDTDQEKPLFILGSVFDISQTDIAQAGANNVEQQTAHAPQKRGDMQSYYSTEFTQA